MDLFYILTAFGVLCQIILVHGLHASLPATSDRTYQGQRTVARSGSRPVVSARVGYRETARRRQPRFRQNHIFQRHMPDASAFGTYLRNYQTLQNRNFIRPLFPLPIHQHQRPHVHLHQRPPTLRHVNFGIPEPVSTPHDGVQHLPSVVRSGTAPGVAGEPGIQQAKKNSLLELLEERRSVIRDENDVILVRKHLIKLNEIRSKDYTDKDRMLDIQVGYIESITDITIQTEVLKIFVKDMVEKSGFLSQNASTVQDIDSLIDLVDKISSVTDRFTKLSQTTANDPWKKFTNAHRISNDPGTTTEYPNNTSESNLRKRIINALSIYDRNAHVSHARNPSTEKSAQTFHGRQRPDTSSDRVLQPSVGMSIFGDTGAETTTLHAQTTEIKRDPIMSEPLGGDNAYWTHLRAGLIDIICNLCRRRRRESCVKLLCSNDTIRMETETPSPAVDQTLT